MEDRKKWVINRDGEIVDLETGIVIGLHEAFYLYDEEVPNSLFEIAAYTISRSI